MPAPVTAVVAGSRPARRDLIVRLLAEDLAIENVITAASLDGVVNEIINSHPGLALIDRDWSEADPFTILPLLAEKSAATSVVIVSVRLSRLDIARARNMGARGFILDSAPRTELVSALKAVLAGATAFPTAARQAGPRRPAHGRHRQTIRGDIEGLTERELQVLTCVARGMSTKQIAQALNVGFKTADRHTSNLMAKLNIHDRVGLALCAVREGLVTL